MIRSIAVAVLALLIPTVASASMAPVQVVTGERMAAIADRLAHTIVTDVDRTIAPAYTIADQSVPVGNVSITAGKALVYPTYVSIPLTIDVDGKLARTVLAGYRVQQYVRTAVAVHDLAPGSVITADELTTARVLWSGRPSVEPSSLVGRKLNVATARGGQLYVEQTSVNELVKSGQGVLLIVRDGPVALTADVVARTGGGLGETVNVYNPQTNKAISGIVIGQNRVEVDLPGALE